MAGVLLNTDVPTISAVQLRRAPGRYLDQVERRQEGILVERGGKPRAVLVPVSEYRAMRRQRFFAMTDAIRRRVVTSGIQPGALQDVIDKAVANVRAESAPPSSSPL